MRIVFMGTPAFAVPSLEKLIEAGHELAGVFTQPDKPKNRGMKLLPPPVKVCAQEHGIPVYQPARLRDGSALAQIQALAPELIVVAAYGRILPDEILDYPKLGCINVHSSLLPRYRGSAPINWAILNGDEKTGVTIMHMATELDAGDIIAQAETAIDPDEVDTIVCAGMGGDLIAQILDRCRWVRDPRYTLILQPQSSGNDLRRKLARMGFAIEQERLVRDGGFLYQAMAARFGNAAPVTPGQEYVSAALLRSGDPLLPDYFDRLIPSLERTVEGLRRGSEPERLQYYETALRELREMRELYDNGC